MKISLGEVWPFPPALRTAPNLERQTLSDGAPGLFPVRDLNCFLKTPQIKG